MSKLHAQCDFLTENYDRRKTARETALESLANAKAVLSSSWLIAESGLGSHGRAELRALTREQHYASGIPNVEQTAPLRHGAAAWA